MIRKQVFFVIAFVCSIFTGFGQLSAGDIAFVQYNADGVDNFAFLALTDIPAGEVIYFTDNEENSLSGGEGTIAWTSPTGGVSCGTIVTITTSPTASLGSVLETNDLNFGGTGDSVLAYQGSAGSPIFIAALHNDGSANTWGGTAGGNLPVGLTNGGTAIAIAEIDNAIYGGIISGTKSTILSSINNSGNWSGSNSVNQTFSGNFLISDCAPSTPTISLNPTSISGLNYILGSGPSAEQTFTASGTNLVNNVSGNITLTAPTNFEISTTSGSGFSGSVTLPQTGGNVTSTTIYVRLAAGLVVNTYSGNITADSNGATTQNVAVSGNVTNLSGGGCSELFISEYVEGSGSNKFIEIYNPTASSITLTGAYDIQIYSNGSSTATVTIPLTGSIASYGVFVLENSLESLGVTADQQSGSLTFNGDDAVVLRSGTTIIDVIGQIGVDPGSEWVGTTCTQGTANGTLVRKATVQAGDTNGSDSFNPDIEWTCFNVDDVSNLGSHTSDCAVVSPTITVSTNGLTGLNYVVGSGPSAEQTFTVSGTNLTANITLTAPANFEISTTSGSGFGNTATLTQTSGNVSSVIIYVRLIASLPINAYTGNLTAASTGATTKNIIFDGEVTCMPTHTITSFAPTSGPVGTKVTIIGTGFSATSAVDFNGVAATVTFVNTTTLVIEVPAGAVSYFITVTEGGCSLDSSSNFMVLNDNGCVGGTIPVGWTDLMFTGIYDDPISSCHYFELFNPTSSDIDLSSYSIGFDNNFTYGSAVPTSGFTGGLITLSGIISAQSTIMVQVSSSGVCNTCSTITPDLTFANGGINVDDRLVLLNGLTVQDVWQNHSSRPGYDITYVEGYIYSRDILSTAPSTTFDFTNWVSNGTESCFGFSISSAILPIINTQPTDVSGCSSSATFTIAASAGNGGALTYQWKYNDGSASGWTNVTSLSFTPGTVTGETSNTLTISGFNLDGYQFYCEVTENGSCSVFSNAAQVDTQTTTWNGTLWNNGLPNINTTVIINGNYNTTNGSFSACNLFVNSSSTLTVNNSSYVEVENNVFVTGTIQVETKGSFVQNNNIGSFTVNPGGTSLVNKTTPSLNNWYEYVNWSSPVVGETVENVLSFAPANRRFYFNAANFVDLLEEIANTGVFLNNPGVDDIDDDGNDWQYATGTMLPGVGYTSTVNSSGFVPGTYQTTFTGPFNNGIIQPSIVNNSGGLYNDWNFIGNPYPCALDANVFFTVNSSVVDSAIYLWSQATPANVEASGNEGANFSNADYAVITGSGVNIAGGDGIIPDSYVPSGQGFFVEAIAAGTVTFNNSMRDTGNNNQFFKNSTKTKNNSNVIWINLSSDNGAFNQLAISYIDGATDGYDGSFYDLKRNISSGNAALLYSIIEGETNKFAIQGKAVSSLNLDETISLGLKTTIDVPTIYKLSIAQHKGDFFRDNTVYLKDNLLSLYHDLSVSDYTFISEPGEFNTRFEIAFKNGENTSNEEVPINLLITELDDGTVRFSVNDKLRIESVQIIDLLGRTLYQLKGNESSETYNLSRVSQAMYIAKVLLSNKQVIFQKAIKRK